MNGKSVAAGALLLGSALLPVQSAHQTTPAQVPSAPAAPNESAGREPRQEPAAVVVAVEAEPVPPADIVPVEPEPELAEPEAIEWRSTYLSAAAESKRTGKPILGLLTDYETCAPCRTLEDNVLSNAVVIEWVNRNTVPYKCKPQDSPWGLPPHKPYMILGYPGMRIRERTPPQTVSRFLNVAAYELDRLNREARR